MSSFLQVFVLLPLLGFFVCLLLPKIKERPISTAAIGISAVQLAGILAFILYWVVLGAPILDIRHITIFKGADIEIFIAFYFDTTTAVFAFAGALLALLVALFSKYYLHREEGFKRFFATLLLFFTGYNLVIFSGNFETLFMGWEILGICSFLLIAFYRDRYLPVKNAFKVISLYRLGDICLVLAMWMSHQLWHQNITFYQLADAALVQQHLADYPGYSLFIAAMILVAAAIKSAQLPFSSWLPRAMEGPTTSSAIFYGSLSVHLGVFLLIRTYPYWQSMEGIRLAIIVLGLITAIVAASIARVQSSVKTQIAYSSIVQIGFMFIEVGLGWHTLALIHFAANAFLRTYQLLVSPSVLSYLIHDMVFSFKSSKGGVSTSLAGKLQNSLYILSLKEWNIDAFLHRFLWSPFKWIGKRLQFLSHKVAMVVLAFILVAGVYIEFFGEGLPLQLYNYLPVPFSLLGLMLILMSFTERERAGRAWLLVIGGQLFITLSIALFHQDFGPDRMLIYLSGCLVSTVVGAVCLHQINKAEGNTDLRQYHGHHYEHPVLSAVFLVACLGLSGLPFTPTFIGIDLIFSHIQKHEIPLIILTALNFLFIELAVLRIYTRVFLGQHKKAYHPIAYRSS